MEILPGAFHAGNGWAWGLLGSSLRTMKWSIPSFPTWNAPKSSPWPPRLFPGLRCEKALIPTAHSSPAGQEKPCRLPCFVGKKGGVQEKFGIVMGKIFGDASTRWFFDVLCQLFQISGQKLSYLDWKISTKRGFLIKHPKKCRKNWMIYQNDVSTGKTPLSHPMKSWLLNRPPRCSVSL